MKMLRGAFKESHQRDSEDVAPPSGNPQADFEKITPIAHAKTVDMRVETPDLLQRPRTSGGPADRGKLFHRKVAPGPLSSEKQTVKFPELPASSSTTVLYTAEVREEGIIGIALGSPSMASPWNINSQSTDFVSSGHGTVTHISSPNSLTGPAESKHEHAKPKISRWKSIFGRKQHFPRQPPQPVQQPQRQKTPPPPPQPQQQQQPQKEQQQSPPFEQTQQTASPPRVDSHHEDEFLEPREAPKPDSPPGVMLFKPEIRGSRKTLMPSQNPPMQPPKPKTIAEIADTAGRRRTVALKKADTSPKSPPKDRTAPPTLPTVVISNGLQNSSARTLNDKPLLDVEIPRIQMERYSVMFGSLLQPNRSSSLLVRRQGNSDRLKPLNELSMKDEEEGSRNGATKPRRATSPSMPKSPVSLSLFPQPGKPRDSRASLIPAALQPRPLQRSKTAPPISPSRQVFAKRPEEKAKVLSQTPRPILEEDVGLKTQLLPPTPSSRRSFDSDQESIIIGRAASPWESFRGEPKWEVVSKHTTDAISHNLHRATALNSHTDVNAISEKGETPKSTDTTPQSTVGVARSVSLSRAAGMTQRAMMRPMVIRTATDPSERLVDKKPLTPTLVELQNRKSQRVQIVEA
jgi:hypothetical protein